MKFVLISFLIGFIIKINLINGLPLFGGIYTEKKIANNYLAKKYCDSLEKNLFKGLSKESTLKYEYFFSSIPDNYIKDKNKFLKLSNLMLNQSVHMISRKLMKKNLNLF